MHIADPGLRWWAYGRKSELLAPGDEEREMIIQNTGRDPFQGLDIRIKTREPRVIIISWGVRSPSASYDDW
jgi:hypothetical protein